MRWLRLVLGGFTQTHSGHDGSLHLALPPALVAGAVARGWAVGHPLAGVPLARGMVMIYGPPDSTEPDAVTGIVADAHATGARA